MERRLSSCSEPWNCNRRIEAAAEGFHIKLEINFNNWFHKNLSDTEAPYQMLTPENESADEMLASVVLRGNESTEVNIIFDDKTSTYSRCWPKFTFSPFTRDPNLQKTKFTRDPNLHISKFTQDPNLHETKFTHDPNLHENLHKTRFTQTQIYTKPIFTRSQIYTNPNLHINM